MGEFPSAIASLLRKFWLPLVLCVAGLAFLGHGLLSLLPKQGVSDLTFVAGEESAEVKGETTKANFVVDVSGAVNNPGVYRFSEESRVQDAIDAAGGMSDEADMDVVAQRMNLAAKLADGMKVYVPRMGDPSASSGQAGTVSNLESSGLININTAGESELESLPGIGKVTAGKIIDNRPYTKIEDLLEKKVVSKSVYEKIKEQIVSF